MTIPTEQQKKAYLKYIGFRGQPDTSYSTLKRIVEGHSFTIPFESINVHDCEFDGSQRKRISLNFNKLFSKLIEQKRGGYCFETNLFLQTMLVSFGFQVKPILPEEIYMSEHIQVGKRPKHVAAIVTYNETEYLVDTAFGSLSPLSPVRLKEGEYPQFSEKFRILRDNDYPFTLQLWYKDKWLSLFGFSKKAATKQDCLRENILQQNPLNPESTFRTFFLCSKAFRISNDQNGHVKIYNNKLIIRRRGKVVHEREITSQSDLHALIKKYFRIDLKGHTIRFSELEMSANLIGIHQPPVLHQYPTRLQYKYRKLKQELNIPEITTQRNWTSRLRKGI